MVDDLEALSDEVLLRAIATTQRLLATATSLPDVADARAMVVVRAELQALEREARRRWPRAAEA